MSLYTLELPGLQEMVKHALREDIGTGDITTMLTVPAEIQAEAILEARSGGVIAGLPIVTEVYRQLDTSVKVEGKVAEGQTAEAGDTIATLSGSARSILMGERVALNYMQRLSGIATLTARFVQLVEGTSARITDTRKTTPGLRMLEKYAVRMGGGRNHRFGLYDAVLIKDNHIAACGSISAAVQSALAGAPHVMSVTVECDDLEQVQEAVAAGADIVLLDNMTPDELRNAVLIIEGQAMTEASGGITEATVAEVARAGVDIISVGALTHSAPALDIGLDLSLK